MKTAFVIMRIGDSQLDSLYRDVICPALKECGLVPRRVDKHEAGGLIKSEITALIDNAHVVIADLTGERPNCYLEVGYVMGKGKFSNLVLTARQDHDVRAPGRATNDPKVHFDLDGYRIIYWDPIRLEAFGTELAQRVKWRMSAIQQPADKALLDGVWFVERRAEALEHIRKMNPRAGLMEVKSTPVATTLDIHQRGLRDAALEADRSGGGLWPIACFMTDDEESPKPIKDGIVAKPRVVYQGRFYHGYWSIRHDGAFFGAKTLEEDAVFESAGQSLRYDWAVRRDAQAIKHLCRLYERLGVDAESTIAIRISYSGVRNRTLRAPPTGRPPLTPHRTGDEPPAFDLVASLNELHTGIAEHVARSAGAVLALFNFFQLEDAELGKYVTDS